MKWKVSIVNLHRDQSRLSWIPALIIINWSLCDSFDCASINGEKINVRFAHNNIHNWLMHVLAVWLRPFAMRVVGEANANPLNMRKARIIILIQLNCWLTSEWTDILHNLAGCELLRQTCIEWAAFWLLRIPRWTDRLTDQTESIVEIYVNTNICVCIFITFIVGHST